MKNMIVRRTLMGFALIVVLFFGEYSARQERENMFRKASAERARQNEKQEDDYTTLREPEEPDIYADSYCTFSYNKSVFYLNFQEENSGFITISIRALELPKTPEDEAPAVFLIGTTSNTEDYEKYTANDASIKFQQSFTQKLCHKIFNADDEFEVLEEDYITHTGPSVEYKMTLSNGSVCYAKIIRFDEVITYTLLRESPYSHVLTPYYHEVYESIEAVTENKKSDSST